MSKNSSFDKYKIINTLRISFNYICLFKSYLDVPALYEYPVYPEYKQITSCIWFSKTQKEREGEKEAKKGGKKSTFIQQYPSVYNHIAC